MQNYENLYSKIYDKKNLVLAYKKARKGKTKKEYVIKFEKDIGKNLLKLHEELKTQTYKPKLLKTFILRDPKTRKISKSDFRDRIIHHALCNVIEPIFQKSFIYDSCANQKGKGNLFTVKRFELFKRKVTHNLQSSAFCFKADIKHYFQEVNHKLLLKIISRKIKDKKVILLITKILQNTAESEEERARDLVWTKQGGGYQNKPINSKGMPLGNLTSQFFANVYLNDLDYFIKQKLKSKFYLRYVDDFVILHKSKKQLQIWKNQIEIFLKQKLKLELHPDKSKIISLSRGVDFVGFRIFWKHKLIRKRSVIKMFVSIRRWIEKELSLEKIKEIFQGWNAHSKWSNTFKLRTKIFNLINS